MDDSRNGKKAAADNIHKQDDGLIPAFVSAPPADDPECFLHVDVLPIRDILAANVDIIRAASGLPPISAAASRQRRANMHRKVAAEFVRRRRDGLDASNDELCRDVQAAMDLGVFGSCAYCGCNFGVVAVREILNVGLACGLCFRPLRVHQPAPVPRAPAPNEDERFKGWTPW